MLTGDDVRCVIPSTKASGCNVCGDGSCDRDRAAGKHIQPWTTIQIHPDLDEAVDDVSRMHTISIALSIRHICKQHSTFSC